MAKWQKAQPNGDAEPARQGTKSIIIMKGTGAE